MLIFATVALTSLGASAILVVGRAIRGAHFDRALRSSMFAAEGRPRSRAEAGDPQGHSEPPTPRSDVEASDRRTLVDFAPGLHERAFPTDRRGAIVSSTSNIPFDRR